MPSSYERIRQTPSNFVFSVKGARFITRMKKLRDVKVPSANFFASGVLALREKLGPNRWQFPPQFGWKEEWPLTDEWTVDLVYCRLRGDTQLYVSGYSDHALKASVDRIWQWRKGPDGFAYFANDAKVHAPFGAQGLGALLPNELRK